MQLGEMTLEETAEIAKGNWRDFESFCWYRESEIPDSENQSASPGTEDFTSGAGLLVILPSQPC